MDGAIDTVKRATLNIHIQQLEQKCQKLSQLDTEIAALFDKPEDLEQEILESEELQCTIAEEICRAKTFLEVSGNQQAQELIEPAGAEQIEPPNAIAPPPQDLDEPATSPPQAVDPANNSPSQAANLDTSVVSTGSNSSVSLNVSRLPKLTLPTFDGNPLYWQSFWDSYRAYRFISIHITLI